MLRCPSLPSHPQHELVKRQQFGHSGMLSFYIKGALEHSKIFLSSLQVDRISIIEDLQVVSVCVWRILNQSSQKNERASVLPTNYQSIAVLTKFCFEYLLFVCHDKYRSEKMKEHSITDTNGLNR